jgi:hypothetical protein
LEIQASVTRRYKDRNRPESPDTTRLTCRYASTEAKKRLFSKIESYRLQYIQVIASSLAIEHRRAVCCFPDVSSFRPIGLEAVFSPLKTSLGLEARQQSGETQSHEQSVFDRRCCTSVTEAEPFNYGGPSQAQGDVFPRSREDPPCEETAAARLLTGWCSSEPREVFSEKLFFHIEWSSHVWVMSLTLVTDRYYALPQVRSYA